MRRERSLPVRDTPGVSDMIEAYVAELRSVLGGDLTGIHLHGSIAHGAYDPGVSDIDVAVLHRSDLCGERMLALRDLHKRLARIHSAADELDASYVPSRLIGAYAEKDLPYFRGGRFNPRGGGDVNPVMWHTLRARGVTLWGSPPAAVVPPVSRKEMAENMRRNLNFLSRRMPRYVVGGTEHQVFGVLTLCRILYTLHTREVASKATAAAWAMERVDHRWRPLIGRTSQRYESHNFAGRDWLLTRRAMAFAAYIKEIAQDSRRKPK